MAYDARFRHEFVPQRYRDVVARAAVLYPIIQCDRRRTISDKWVVAATHKIVTLWRTRVLQLADCGWERAQPGASGGPNPVDFMRNCRPNFVSMFPRTRPCKAWHVCPFCWSRTVQDIYDRVDKVFPDTSLVEAPAPVILESDASPAEGVRVLAAGERRSRSIILARDDAKICGDGKPRKFTSLDSRDFPYHLVTVTMRNAQSAKNSLPNLVTNFCATRGGIRSIPFAGALIFTTVEHRTRQWHLAHRYLLMVPKEAEVPLSFQESPGYRRIEQPTRREVMRAVARTCKYPQQLLEGKDVSQIVRILHAIHGRRLRAFYGCFRNSQNYEQFK
jgi:hypothetical protein